MEGYRSLPFAMYDLAVYLPGGAIFIAISKVSIDSLFGIGGPFLSNLSSNETIRLVLASIVWLSASYFVGHLAAFVSTYVVEKLVHNHLGYPSEVWLVGERVYRSSASTSFSLHQFFRDKLCRWPRGWVSYLILVAQLPALLPLALVFWLKPFGFYSPKLPAGLSNLVEQRLRYISQTSSINDGNRWEKLVEHFVSNKCPVAYTRMYNYLVIYGALRILSLAIIFACWMLIIDSTFNGLSGGEFDGLKAFLILSMPFAYVLSVMAFAKFNRRFFEESILAFVIAPRSELESIRT